MALSFLIPAALTERCTCAISGCPTLGTDGVVCHHGGVSQVTGVTLFVVLFHDGMQGILDSSSDPPRLERNTGVRQMHMILWEKGVVGDDSCRIVTRYQRWVLKFSIWKSLHVNSLSGTSTLSADFSLADAMPSVSR